MSDAEREDWTLRWSDGRPFDVEASRFVAGVRGRVKLIFPKLAGWMEYGERIEATGSGSIRGRTTGLVVVTDRALVVLVIADRSPAGAADHLIDSMRIPYDDVVSYSFKQRSPLPFLPKLGLLQVRPKQGRPLVLGQIVARQSEALAEALQRHMPAGALRA